MALLESPDDPKDLWQAVGDEVPAHRLLMQGDVVVTDAGPLLVVTHACSMRRGAGLHDTQMVAPIEGHAVPNWDGMATTGCQFPERPSRMSPTRPDSCEYCGASTPRCWCPATELPS